MPLETGTTIEDLDNSWPLGGDAILDGDNHIRLLKSVLKTQFPGLSGNGFGIPVTASEVELNFVDGVTSSVQDQLDALAAADALVAPTGTVMLFYQAAPPVGWTQVTTHNNKMLRVVAAAGGGSGGTDDPIAFDHIHATGDHVLLEAEMPVHSHTFDMRDNTQGVGGGSGFGTATSLSGQVTASTGSDVAHNHGDTENAEFRPLYIDTILAAKD